MAVEPKVVIGVCSLGDLSAEFHQNMINILQHPNVIDYIHVTSSLLPNARNLVVRQIYKENPDFTHILFIDSDMVGFGPAHLTSLLERQEHIVGAICTTNTKPYSICAYGLDPDLLMKEVYKKDPKKKKALEVVSIGTAFLLVTKDALEAVKEETVEKPLWFTTDRMHRPDVLKCANILIKEFLAKKWKDEQEMAEGLMELITFGTQAHRRTPMIGEDISFCWRAREEGFKIYADTRVLIAHEGRINRDLRDTIKEHTLPGREPVFVEKTPMKKVPNLNV